MGGATVSGKMTEAILRVVEPIVFSKRKLMLGILGLLTLFFAFQAAQLKPAAGWLKMVPQQHPYMQTFLQYYKDFGGANTVLIALKTNEGDIYQPDVMEALRKLTDEVFFVPGVDRARVTSIFTPNILYVEIIEGGLSGSTVAPTDYTPTPEVMDRMRANVGKANVIGRLVSEDASTAMVLVELLENDPVSGEQLDYTKVGDKLEEIRAQFENDKISVHMIGFAKVVDDMTDAATEVAMFFVVSLVLTAVLLLWYVRSVKLTALVVIVSLVAVIWEMGLLRTAGFGIDPFALLVPFLILSVSVSHGVQYVSCWSTDLAKGSDNYHASLATFRELAIPGTTALITDLAGFVTMYVIDIEVIREMAFNAAFGMMAIIITNKVMMPELLSYVTIKNAKEYIDKIQKREAKGDVLWRKLAMVTRKGPATAILVVCAILLGWSMWLYPSLQTGDTTEGVPELKPDSRFNKDAREIAANFSLAVDQLKIIAETVPDACIIKDVMEEIDSFNWYMKNQPGVRDVMSLLDLAKLAYQGLNEGRPNAEILPSKESSLAQATALVPTTTGFLNDNCDALALFVFTADHKADTISRLVQAVKDYKPQNDKAQVKFRLASGNVGVMAATNEVVKEKEIPIIAYVYAVILLFLWLSFRTFSGVICVVLPLGLVSMLVYAVMVLMNIGAKVATLPVVALATGIGVDYGIYIYSVMASGLRSGLKLEEAYFQTLRHTGKAVIFTGISLALSVVTWLLSKLQFQIDMGVLLVFAFSANMLGAVIVCPALAYFFAHEESKHAKEPIASGSEWEAINREPHPEDRV